MKVEIINEEDIDVFINPCHFNEINLNDKESLLKEIKIILTKIDSRYKLNLSGFYKIKVYPHKKIGIFLNIIKIDDNEFNQEADFRIIIYPDEVFYFETEEYDIIPKTTQKRYYQGKFYINIEDIKDITSIIDMGKIIYGQDAKKILMKSKIIK